MTIRESGRGGPVADRATGPSCVGARALRAVLALVVVLAVGRCRDEADLPEPLRGVVELDGDAVLHTVTLGGRDEGRRVQPPELRVAPGDAVQFVTADGRPHAIEFGPRGLAPALRSFLDGTDQLTSPPMVNRESRFVVTFRRAPEGVYPFRCRNHPDRGRGRVVVTEP